MVSGDIVDAVADRCIKFTTVTPARYLTTSSAINDAIDIPIGELAYWTIEAVLVHLQ
jgi:hypothetical protein